MSNKRSQRARQRTPRPQGQTQATRPAAPPAAAQPIRVARPVRAPSRQEPKEVNFREEYHYVVNDLKRIAVYAAGLLILLIILALIFA